MAHNFNPPFSPQYQRIKKPETKTSKTDAAFRLHAGAIKARANKIKPSMPKMPWDDESEESEP
jgi:hypothetical protein